MDQVEPNTLEVLHECCIHRTPAIILSAETGVVYDARIASLSSESIALDVFSAETDLSPKASILVSFLYRGNSRAFFAAILDYRKRLPPAPSELVLKIPSETFGIQPRMAYRVPIDEDTRLYVRVGTKDGHSWTPRPMDLSLAGMSVEFPAGEDPDLSIGTETEVELLLESNSVKCKGVVKRHHRHQYGFFFPDVFCKQGIVPPEPLRTIVEILERAWLQK